MREMYEGRPRALFVRYAVPQMVGLVCNSVYFIVDGIFIGNRLGRGAMAAAAVSVPFIELLLALSMLIASGAGVMISGCLARGDREGALRAFNAAVRFTAAAGCAIAIPGKLLIDELAVLMGSTPRIHASAVEYLGYIVAFSPFLMFSFLLGGMARNDGRPRLAMFALSLGSISNIVLDYVFLYPMDMGIAGAALATAIGPVLSVLILLPHFIFRRGALYPARRRTRMRDVRNILALGFPSFVMEFSIGIVSFAYNTAIVHYGLGEAGLAAYLLIGYLMLIILTVFLGMAEGLQPVFSYLDGAGDRERGEALRKFSAGVFVAAGLACCLPSAFWGRAFFSMFSPGDGELIAFASRSGLLYFCAFFPAGYNILMISFWQSTRRTRRSLAVSLMRSAVLPPLLLMALPLLFGREAVWACHALAECLTAAVALALLRREISIST